MTDLNKYENENPNFAPYAVCVEVMFHHEYSAGGDRRGKNRRLSFENIRLYGRQQPSFVFAGHSKEANVSDITIKDFYYNGKKLCDGEYALWKNEYCENIVIK